MTRGKVRPNLLNYAKAHAAKTVEDASAAALRALDDVLANEKPAASALESALAPLVALKGIGPATASAVLAAATEDLPMMSDELIAVALPATSSSDTYSAPRLVALAKAARAKGMKTGAHRPGGRTSGVFGGGVDEKTKEGRRRGEEAESGGEMTPRNRKAQRACSRG